MCIIVVALGVRPDLPLVVLANRDEQHARPSDRAHAWPDTPNVFGGRDRTAGGTWLGGHGRQRVAQGQDPARLAVLIHQRIAHIETVVRREGDHRPPPPFHPHHLPAVTRGHIRGIVEAAGTRDRPGRRTQEELRAAHAEQRLSSAQRTAKGRQPFVAERRRSGRHQARRLGTWSQRPRGGQRLEPLQPNRGRDSLADVPEPGEGTLSAYLDHVLSTWCTVWHRHEDAPRPLQSLLRSRVPLDPASLVGQRVFWSNPLGFLQAALDGAPLQLDVGPSNPQRGTDLGLSALRLIRPADYDSPAKR